MLIPPFKLKLPEIAGSEQTTAHIHIWSNITLVAFLALCVLIFHYPGQASVDTIVQLQDGLSRIYDSNQPPSMSFILANLTLPGTLILNTLLFSLSVVRLLYLIPVNHQRQLIAVVFLFCFPILLIYIGIVWKDVLFAHAALRGLLLLPGGKRLHWKTLALSAAALALGTSVRQQGVIIVLVAVFYLVFASGMSTSRFRRWQAVAFWITVYVLCSGGIKLAVDASGDTSKSVAFVGPFYQLALFDLGGIAYHNPDLSFPSLEKSASEVTQEHRPTRERILAAITNYNPERQDYMWESLKKANIRFPHKALFNDWLTRILEYPGTYFAHRLDVLSWILGCHDTTKCLPYQFGISSQPEEMVTEIGIEPGTSDRAKMLEGLGNLTMFLFRPVIYLILSLAVAGFLIKRDWRQHSLIITIQIAGLIYAATYLLVGIACDFRYTYFSTLTALFGLAYVFVAGFVVRSKTCEISSEVNRAKGDKRDVSTT